MCSDQWYVGQPVVLMPMSLFFSIYFIEEWLIYSVLIFFSSGKAIRSFYNKKTYGPDGCSDDAFLWKSLVFILLKPLADILDHSLQYKTCFLKSLLQPSFLLFSNINKTNSEKYMVICNKFSDEDDNALVSSNISLKFTVTDYVERFDHYDKMSVMDFSGEKTIQRIAFVAI